MDVLKLMFSKKATKIDKIITVDLTLCSKCQFDGEDFINFCGLLRKHELYNAYFMGLKDEKSAHYSCLLKVGTYGICTLIRSVASGPTVYILGK
jgi:hypothetical protein